MKKLLLLLAAANLFTAVAFAADKGAEIKVVSYNIRLSTGKDGSNAWENRKPATLAMLKQESPDLVGMQEVLKDQYDYVKENMSEYGITGRGRDDGQWKGEMMAVMYLKERFDLLEEGHFWLSETPDQVSRGWDGACNRMVSWLKLLDKRTAKEVYFFNTHLDHKGELARSEGAKLVAEKIKQIAGKNTFFLVGDFNATSQDKVLAPFEKGFTNVRGKAKETDNKGTFNGFGTAPSNIVIDHIYYKKATPLVYKTLTESYGSPFISDHYPIMAIFQVK